jgi:glycosyltransferase involved in cell wall biosynthesis
VQVFTRFVERMAIRAASRTLVLSSRSADLLAAPTVEVMPDCLDVEDFAARARAGAAAFATRLGLPAEAPVALFVGRVSKEKGWPDLIELAVRLRDRRLQLLVCGDGEDLEALRSEARRRGVAASVHTLGAVPADDVAAAMGLADVLVLPSWHEELGSVLIEAMAAGLPAVAYDAGGTSEAIEPGVTGLIVDRGDLDGLVEATARVLDDAELRERARSSGPHIAIERFDGARVSKRLAELYASLG